MSEIAEQIREKADTLLAAQQLDDAIAAYREAIKLQPDDVAAMNNLSFVLLSTGKIDEAMEVCKRAIALRPDLPIPYQNLADALRQLGRLDEAIECYRSAPQSPMLVSEMLYTMHLMPQYGPPRLLEEHRAWARTFAGPLKHLIKRHGNDRSPDRRLRVGYVAHHLGNHPLGRFLEPLLENRDKRQFEIFCYCNVLAGDHVGENLRKHADHWRTTRGISDEAVAELVRDDQIDILVDLLGHAGMHRLLAFARKPAPVQVTYLSYASTTGMDTIDYRLTDRYLDPLDKGDTAAYLESSSVPLFASYTEESVRLLRCFWCYPAPPEAPAVRPPPLEKTGKITFGCFNASIKITTGTLQTWCEILKRLDGSTLVVFCPEGTPRRRMLEQIQAHGVAPDRVTFVRQSPMPVYFHQYHHIDIALDPFPFPGGTTTCDALWMGVPVVSLAGQTAVSRGGLSILSNIGLGELVARSQDEYVKIACDLAANVQRLQELRHTMRQRMQSSPLMNAVEYARDIEAAYRMMWVRWCATK